MFARYVSGLTPKRVCAFVSFFIVSVLFFTLAGCSARTADEAESGSSTAPVTGPFTVSDTSTEGKDTVDVFFDYSCPHCAELDTVSRELYTDLAKDGSVTLRFTPVDTVGAEWNTVATAAVTQVYLHDKEHFLAYHHALMEWFKENVVAKSDFAKAQDADAARAVVAKLAEKVGVDPKLVSAEQLDVKSASSYLKLNTSEWISNVKRADRKKVGTPEVALNGVKLEFKGSTVKEIADNLRKQLVMPDGQSN